MTYNVHQGANVAGSLDLEGIASAIEAQHPEVVVLQEVVRGQLITGSTDMAEWLAVRLGMTYRFAPAQDATFGELLLTRFPVLTSSVGILPRGNAVQWRSYVKAFLDVGRGRTLTVIGTHLDHTSVQSRVAQAEALVQLWNHRPFTLLAGDLNTTPNTADIQALERAGLQSAQDVTGHAGLFTFPSTAPQIRIDWVFATPDLSFHDFAIPPTLASDHLPVVVTISIL